MVGWVIAILLCLIIKGIEIEVAELKEELNKEKARRLLDIQTLWDRINKEGDFANYE
jgi:hypothetical protein